MIKQNNMALKPTLLPTQKAIVGGFFYNPFQQNLKIALLITLLGLIYYYNAYASYVIYVLCYLLRIVYCRI